MYGRNDDAGRFGWFCGAAAEFIRIEGLKCGPAPAAGALGPLLTSPPTCAGQVVAALPDGRIVACLLLPQGRVCCHCERRRAAVTGRGGGRAGPTWSTATTGPRHPSRGPSWTAPAPSSPCTPSPCPPHLNPPRTPRPSCISREHQHRVHMPTLCLPCAAGNRQLGLRILPSEKSCWNAHAACCRVPCIRRWQMCLGGVMPSVNEGMPPGACVPHRRPAPAQPQPELWSGPHWAGHGVR